MAPPASTWLTVPAYKAWARIDPADTADDAAIGDAVSASSEAIQLRAPAAFLADDTGTISLIDAASYSVTEAGLLLTNRLLSRRNSPDGVVGVSDMGTARIASYDADISGLLGPWMASVVA